MMTFHQLVVTLLGQLTKGPTVVGGIRTHHELYVRSDVRSEFDMEPEEFATLIDVLGPGEALWLVSEHRALVYPGDDVFLTDNAYLLVNQLYGTHGPRGRGGRRPDRTAAVYSWMFEYSNGYWWANTDNLTSFHSIETCNWAKGELHAL